MVTVQTVQVFGFRVRQARVLRQMTATAVMKHMGWRSPRQTRLEQAETAVLDTDEFDRLVMLLRFPPKFFTTAPVSRVSAQDLLFRAPKSTSVTEKEYLAVFATVAGDLLDELNAHVKLPTMQLDTLPPGTDVTAAAARTRTWLGLEASEPIKYLTHDLERAGVPVILRLKRSRSTGRTEWDAEIEDPAAESTEKHLGCSARTGEFRERPLVLLRSTDSWERTRWTLAHEIGHIVLHRHGDVSDDQEYEASRFASELLAPAAAIRKEIPAAPTLKSLIDVKLKWGISLGSLIIHLHESKLIDTNRAKMLQRQLYTRINTDTGHTWGRTEPGWDERKPERPRLLIKWVQRCYGASSADMLAAHELMFPADLLSDFLAGQRGAPSRTSSRPAPSPVSDADGDGAEYGTVVQLSRIRACRQA